MAYDGYTIVSLTMWQLSIYYAYFQIIVNCDRIKRFQSWSTFFISFRGITHEKVKESKWVVPAYTLPMCIPPLQNVTLKQPLFLESMTCIPENTYYMYNWRNQYILRYLQHNGQKTLNICIGSCISMGRIFKHTFPTKSNYKLQCSLVLYNTFLYLTQ